MLLPGKTEYFEGGNGASEERKINAHEEAIEGPEYSGRTRAATRHTGLTTIFDLHFIREWRAAKWRIRSANRDLVL
jgi:hypothetical protein